MLIFPYCEIPTTVRRRLNAMKQKNSLERISFSLPQEVLAKLDEMTEQCGHANRSAAIRHLIETGWVNYSAQNSNQVMAGTITLFYDAAQRGTSVKIMRLQRTYIAEVISSFNVLLEEDHIMCVLLVQGPTDKLQDIANQLTAIRGVKSGQLNLTGALMPPIHARQ